MLESIADIFNTSAKYVIPLLLAGIPCYGLVAKKVKVYEVFVEGAKEGFNIAIRIIPFMVAILVALGMFRASGALDLFLGLLSLGIKSHRLSTRKLVAGSYAATFRQWFFWYLGGYGQPVWPRFTVF